MFVALGPRRYDITHRALVMGILNRTPDSFFDRGATWDFDAFLATAEQLVADGADFLDVGGVKAGPGPEVTEAEEMDRVVPAVDALIARFDLPVSVDTFRASVARPAMPPVRSSATTSPASPTPATSPRPPKPAPRWWPPTSAWRLGYRIPSRPTTTSPPRSVPSSPTEPPRPWPPASPRTG